MTKKSIGMQVFLVLCVVLAASGGPGAEPTDKFICRGKVVDFKAQPVAGAQVVAYGMYELDGLFADGKPVPELLCEVTETDAKGVFALNFNIRDGYKRSVIVVARKEGLALGWGRVHECIIEPKLNIVLDKPSILAGTVVDEAGTPIPGAYVRMYLWGRPSRHLAAPKDWLTTKTDLQGRFRFDNVPADGKAYFLVTASGQGSVRNSEPGGRGAFRFFAGQTDIRIVLPPEARVEGQVIHAATGKPVAGAKILARRQISPSRRGLRVHQTVSGKDGRFVLEPMVPHTYTLEVMPLRKAAGASPKRTRKTIVANPGRTTRTTIAVATVPAAKLGDLRVVVRDAKTNQPIRDALTSVFLEAELAAGFSFGETFRTNPDGVAQVRVPFGNYRITASKKWYVRGNPEIVNIGGPRPTKAEILLDPCPEVTGTLRDEGGRPVPGATVWAGNPACSVGKTDTSGEFAVSYKFRHPFWARYLFARHEQRGLAGTIKFSDPPAPLDITLRPAWTLIGRVTDPDGAPVPAATVRLGYKQRRPGGWVFRGYVTGSEVTSDPRGRFEITTVPPVPPAEGDIQLCVHAQALGHGRFSHKRVSLTKVGEGRFEVEPIVMELANLSVSGTVVGPGGRPVPGIRVFLGVAGPTRPGANQPRSKEAITDAHGRFTLRGVCKGPLRLQAGFPSRPGGAGFLEAHGGDKDVKIVLGQKGVHQPQLAGALGKPLGELGEFNVQLSQETTAGKRVLVCFWDMNQRPSRQCIQTLANIGDHLASKDVVVVSLETSKTEPEKRKEWLDRLKIPFPTGRTLHMDKQKLLSIWGVQRLPWLILTDPQHIVRAEGFGVAELNEKLDALPAREKAKLRVTHRRGASQDTSSRTGVVVLQRTHNPPLPAKQSEDVTCRGKVVDADGRAITEVAVQAYGRRFSAGTESKLTPLGETRTDKDGEFSFTAKGARNYDELFIVSWKAPQALGWYNSSRKGSKAAGPEAVGTITLGEPGKLSGKVIDETGAPIARATVRAILRILDSPTQTWIPGLDPLEWLAVKTDAQGRFEFTNIPSDATADFIASAPGRARIFTLIPGGTSRSLQYPAGQTDIRITLPPEARIEGTVIEKSTGNPVGGVKLSVRRLGPTWLDATPAVSADDGSFGVGGLHAGGHAIFLVPPAQGDVEWTAKGKGVPAEPGKTTSGVRFEVSKGGLIEVLVKDALTRKPIQGAGVTISRLDNNRRGRELFLKTGEDGIARFCVFPGKCGIRRVVAPGYISFPRRMTVVIGKQGEERLLLPKQVSVLEGKIERLTVELRSSALLGKGLPQLDELKLSLSPDTIRGKRMLLCFWDVDQRPSRHCIQTLAKIGEQLASKDVVVVAVHAGSDERQSLRAWMKKNNVRFPVGQVASDAKKRQSQLDSWCVQGLPWLILTDRQHIVRAEGFGIAELNEKLKDLAED